MNILEFKDINKSFYRMENKKRLKIQVLKNINLEIKENESLGIIGNSGSGKTTLVKILFDLHKADSGHIIYKNKNISNIKGKERQSLYKNMGFVMQDPYSSLCPYLTIKEIISEPIKIHNIHKNIENLDLYVSNLLEKVHLNPSIYMNKYPKELSGGERQRVAIARSISTKPSFLVLDEPTSMIDAHAKNGVLNLLEELKTNEKISIVMISHDISTVINNCDRIAVMKDGKIIECKTAIDIKNNPDNKYTKELILASNNLIEYWEYLNKVEKNI